MPNVFREARIILPASAEFSALAKIEAKLVSAFGGFTRHMGYGAWRNPTGTVEMEQVLVYDIAVPAFDACQPDRAWLGSAGKLFDIARDAARMLAQECVYLRLPDGEVHLVTPKGRNINPDTASPVYLRAEAFWRARDQG
jgi:hypothetical protein